MASNFFRVNKGVGLNPQASAPSSPRNGEFYYDDGLAKFQFRQAGSWLDISGGGGGVAGLTTDATSGNYTVASGTTLFAPYMSIGVSDTITVNGQLVGVDSITVSGTLVVNGTCKILA